MAESPSRTLPAFGTRCSFPKFDPRVDTALTNEPQSEPCPAPLAWQEVAQSFRADAAVRLVATDDAEITMAEFGQGPPLVVLPPLAGSSLLYCLTAWLLKDDCRLLLLDAPRFGRTPRPRDLIARTADAFSVAIEHVCPEGADLYAPSASGQTALDLMARYPRLVRRALLQGAWAARRWTFAEKLLLRAARWLPMQVRRTPLWLPSQIQNHRRWFPPFDDTRFGFLLNEAGSTRLSDLGNRLLAAGATDLRPRLPAVSQPVLVLRCEGDGPLIDAAQTELEQGLPHARGETLSMTGHYPYLTHPHRLVKIIKNFLLEPALSHD